MGALAALGIGIGGGALVSGFTGWMSARGQERAAREAAARAERAGQQGQEILAGSLDDSLADVNRGFDRAQGYYGQAGDLLAGGQQTLRDTFAQERDVGSQALTSLQDIILGGNTSALTMDPGYQFRLEQGNQAIERAAAAAGSFGGGGNLKDFARFSQGLASQEFNNSIQRLLGLANLGSNANANFAQLSTGLLGNQANVFGNQANTAAQGGLATSSLRQNNAAAQANALNNTAANINNYNLQASNANAQGYNAINNAVQTGLQGAGTLYALNQISQYPGSRPEEIRL